ncbi:hypothetical protein [Pseudolactococcus insecticola]|uniref:Uncharacterized protein n=1 Tax=Pseudolactococcus insecticola TaxID=2709158 RepID=A0A6A0B7W6_9LACT|nr:hypothetical protein [Lactococcus insecticola]GFH41430.1 hypothetical protein Hs20B_18280 [Lactococcus insecticola]
MTKDEKKKLMQEAWNNLELPELPNTQAFPDIVWISRLINDDTAWDNELFEAYVKDPENKVLPAGVTFDEFTQYLFDTDQSFVTEPSDEKAIATRLEAENYYIETSFLYHKYGMDNKISQLENYRMKGFTFSISNDGRKDGYIAGEVAGKKLLDIEYYRAQPFGVDLKKLSSTELSALMKNLLVQANDTVTALNEMNKDDPDYVYFENDFENEKDTYKELREMILDKNLAFHVHTGVEDLYDTITSKYGEFAKKNIDDYFAMQRDVTGDALLHAVEEFAKGTTYETNWTANENSKGNTPSEAYFLLDDFGLTESSIVTVKVLNNISSKRAFYDENDEYITLKTLLEKAGFYGYDALVEKTEEDWNEEWSKMVDNNEVKE